MRILGTLAVSFLPAGLYLFVGTRPSSFRFAPWVSGAILVACVAAIFLRRSGAVFGTFLLLLSMMILPKLGWVVHRAYDGTKELRAARVRIEAFKSAHGRPPKDLAELGPLPALEIWTVDARGREHMHPRTSVVAIRRSGETPPDDGAWGYDPERGRLFISCTGLEPVERKMALYGL